MAEEFYEPIRQLVEAHFKSQWDSIGAGVPVQYENAPFTQPAAGVWVALNLLFADGYQGSIGSVIMERQNGFAIVRCFCKRGQGSKPALQLADKAARALRYRQLTDGETRVSTSSCSLSKVAEEETLYQVNIAAEFDARRLVARNS